MTLPSQHVNLKGNQISGDAFMVTYDAMTNVETPLTTRASVCAGTGAPTFSANKGTLYINLTGSSSSTRLYVNSTGSTTWVNVTTSG